MGSSHRMATIALPVEVAVKGEMSPERIIGGFHDSVRRKSPLRRGDVECAAHTVASSMIAPGISLVDGGPAYL